MRELLLDPIGMSDGTYEQPLPAARAGQAATAHPWKGRPLPGRWHVYPEMAAAGLWTTPARSRILRLLTPVLAPSPAPAPSPDRATVAESPPDRVGPPARMVVDLRHPLKSGTLHLWVDDEEVLGRPVRGTVTRDLLAVKLREGVFTQVLEVEPGRHVFRVEVSWDEETRSRSIQGRLQRGETYRLEIRLSRLGKDLSLRWTR